MPLFRFRVAWEEDDQVHRDIEMYTSQSFLDLHQTIVKAFEFDGKHPAHFFESDERWNRGRAISSEVLVNKKDAPALSMLKTPVSALVAVPDQKFVYEYDPAGKRWSFQVELIGLVKEEDPKQTYPRVYRKEGVAPAQYSAAAALGLGGKMLEVEEAYDLGAEEMAEGFGSEGEGGSEAAEESPAPAGGYDE